ncbi:MAG: YdeI/OmpD-associated family protein [bacterium]
MKTTIRFKAVLTKGFIHLPKSVKLTVGNVEGIINSLPFRTTLDSKNSIKLNRSMQNVAKIGETVTIEITKIDDEIETRVPTELKKTLPNHPKALSLWEGITPIARRDWIFWIISGKQEETRMKRVITACSKLSSGMRRVCCFGGINWLMKTGGK